jgi:hypothetical protein
MGDGRLKAEIFKNGIKNIIFVLKCYKHVDIFDEKE